MPAPVNPYLYLPMEIASRELDSRLLITLFAAKSGMDVVIGQKWLLQKNVKTTKPGVWLFKTLTVRDGEAMKSLTDAGHRVSAIDEEMPGLGEGCENLRWVNDQTVSRCETIFCLGERHRRAMVEMYPDQAEKMTIAGNPRWDVMRPELRGLFAEEVARFRKEHAPFILINTNVGLMNSAKGTADQLVDKLAKAGKVDLSQPDDKKFIDDLKAFESANFDAVPGLIKRLLAEFPDHNVVLRPHPTEKLEPYQAAIDGNPRARIVREGSAAPWIAASDGMIHTSCTTATEAFALGVNTVCYQTAPSSFHEYFLSGSLSDVATNEDEVIGAMRNIVDTGKGSANDPEKTKTFHYNFAAQSGPFAAEVIVGEAQKKMKSDAEPWKPGLFFKRWNWRTEYQKRVMPDYAPEVIETRLNVLAKTMGEHDLALDVRRCGRGIYHVRRKP
ncbi:MAG: surface carbohydrate biosynthesis protein [Pikeienuella sp.]